MSAQGRNGSGAPHGGDAGYMLGGFKLLEGHAYRDQAHGILYFTRYAKTLLPHLSAPSVRLLWCLSLVTDVSWALNSLALRRHVRQAGWPGKLHPNSTSPPWDSFADILDCTEGCLFDVINDPSERYDLSRIMPDLLTALKGKLRAAEARWFNPDRGALDPRACAIANATGHWQPFMD
mmetsp:Transcript_87106/g.174006  ORF Transcript_87106/g.174006 Transcript_87106/m.174006 type:complete len:178 (+) Transcript_87106:1379-1912(+)